MTFTETLTTILVLLGVFILAYSAIRHKDIPDILTDIKDAIKGKAEDIKDGDVIKYG